MEEQKIGSFKNNNKEVKLTVEKGKIITLSDERNLLQKFMIISRRRSYLNLEDYIGEYDFGEVPRALFDADGSVLLEKQIYEMSSMLKKLGENFVKEPVNVLPPSNKIIIFDTMAVVNSLPKDKNAEVEACKDLA